VNSVSRLLRRFWNGFSHNESPARLPILAKVVSQFGRSERLPRSTQSCPVLPIAARFRPVRESCRARPLFRCPPVQGHACVAVGQTEFITRRLFGSLRLMRPASPPPRHVPT